MVNPAFIKEAVPQRPQDNQYFQHAEDGFNFLKKVYSGEVMYFSDFASMAVNSLERYYKAIISEKYKDMPEAAVNYTALRGHNIKELVDCIEGDGQHKLFNCNTPQDYYNRNVFLKSLTKIYTTARYSEQIPFSDFKHIFEVLKQQRENVKNIMHENDKSYGYDHEDDDFEMEM